MPADPRPINRLRYRNDDPRRYLHVPKAERLDDDTGPDSVAADDITGEPDAFDRDAVRARTTIVDEADLQ